MSFINPIRSVSPDSSSFTNIVNLLAQSQPRQKKRWAKTTVDCPNPSHPAHAPPEMSLGNEFHFSNLCLSQATHFGRVESAGVFHIWVQENRRWLSLSRSAKVASSSPSAYLIVLVFHSRTNLQLLSDFFVKQVPSLRRRYFRWFRR